MFMHWQAKDKMHVNLETGWRT